MCIHIWHFKTQRSDHGRNFTAPALLLVNLIDARDSFSENNNVVFTETATVTVTVTVMVPVTGEPTGRLGPARLVFKR